MPAQGSQFIVITTIAAPTAAVREMAGLPDWHVISVGDRKTPPGWQCPNSTFLAVDDAETLTYRLASLLPYNHYARKMLGYIWGLRRGATVIYDTDDDNRPQANWRLLPFDGAYPLARDDGGFVNIYLWFGGQDVWPRGFPLDGVTSPEARLDPFRVALAERIKVGVWQGLVDGDTDVDAIYRLTRNTLVQFTGSDPLVLGRGTCCPYNSQNTFYRRDMFPLLYLPAFVAFRFTDILRGLVAQPIMWAAGYRLGFTPASVIQERNPHDYLKDFEQELPCYLQSRRALAAVEGAVSSQRSVRDNLLEAYRALGREEIVVSREIGALEAWLEDIEANS